ncbi:S24 family peptidase [Burkholderia glumae]|uniref:S24 family peptidase n=1 Tax=Burkholderia glumae TaxID=337 RepID=UPI0021503CE1|nr:S24 family peptidase [Burkholderia glumae]
MKTNDEIRRENLVLAIARFGTAKALAEAADVSTAYLSQVKNGQPDSKTGKPKNMGDEVARKIEVALGEAAGWMDTNHSEGIGAPYKLPEDKGKVLVWEHPDDLPPDEDRVWMDQYDYRFSAGTGLIQWEIRQKKALPFDIGFFKALGVKPQDCRLARVHGRSMEPYLFNRDMMMICEAKTHIRDGQIYAVYFEDEPLVKQIFKEADGALRLHSYNPEFPDRVVTGEQLAGLRIVGEVVYRSGSGLAGGN